MGFLTTGRKVRRGALKRVLVRVPTIWTPRGWIFYSSKLFKLIYRFGVWLIPPGAKQIPFLIARPFSYVPLIGGITSHALYFATTKPVSKYTFFYTFLLITYGLGRIQTEDKKGDHKMKPLDPWVVSFGEVITKTSPTFDMIFGYLSGRKPITKKTTLLPEQPKNIPLKNLPKTLIIANNTLFIPRTRFWSWNPPVKRPGYEEFLKRMSQIYEVVIITNEESWAVEQTINDVDPKRQWISGKLASECMRMIHGLNHFSMLRLGRNVKNVVVLTADPVPFFGWWKNTVCIDGFHHKTKDHSLMQVAPFLEHLAKKDVKDVRTEITRYGDFGWVEYYNNLQKQRGTLNDKLKNRMRIIGKSKSEPKPNQSRSPSPSK